MGAHRLYAASRRKRQVYMKKVFLGISACILVLGLSIFFGSGLADAHAQSKEDSVNYKYYKSIEIQSGDTLWDLAEEYMSEEEGSVQECVQAIMEMNGLTTDEIQEGQYLTVAYYEKEFR